MQKIWNIHNPDPKLQVELSNALNVHPIVAQLLINRGITDIKEADAFINTDLSQLHDPFLFKDMKRIVERIRAAKENNDHVLIFGDYDVDGVTSSTLLRNELHKLGIQVTNHIPHRMLDGYGLNHEIADIAHKKGVKLLITVDCGVTAVEEIESLNKVGIDVIVVDHHEPPDHNMPDAFAILNPKQHDCNYPFHELATVGLVAKIIQALNGKMDEDVLDLVAIGTIADIAPLVNENRVLVKAGLPRVQKTINKGLKALLKITKIEKKVISPYYVGFILGPRINASGRMNSAHKSLDLFLSQTDEEAMGIAKEMEKFNSDRQKMQKDVVQEAMDIVEQDINFSEEKVIVLSKEGWHKGVLGIVASRLADKYYRPSIVISIKEGVGTASARSIDGFHIHDAIENCSKHLENFGGHEGAAGLTIKEENISPFRHMINDLANDTLELKKLTPRVRIDCEIPIKYIDMKLADIISAMEPFGEANPTPIFCSKKVEVASRAAVLGKDTLKFWVKDGDFKISAVGFGMAKFQPIVQPGQKIDLAYEISIDDWNKAPTPQLKLKDIRTSE